LYSGWLRRRGEHIEDGAEKDVLAGIRATAACHPSPQVILQSATVAVLLDHLEASDQTDFPVVDDENRLIGTVSVTDLGRLARHSSDVADVIIAADIAVAGETVGPDDTLLEAVRRMGVRGTGSIPMVDPATGRFLGLVTRAHVLAQYERAIAVANQ
jgi:CBS domain-containing protein